MCWLVVKKEGSKLNESYMDIAQKHNSDGYGVSWVEDKEIHTYKTFDYNVFKKVVSALQQFKLVVHFRAASKGIKSYDNIHPFTVKNGVMFHNGTMHKVNTVGTDSDSKALANMINKCNYKNISDVLPLVEGFTTKLNNKLVFLESNGQITIVNKNLGIEEDGTWYSNDYHLKDKGWCNTKVTDVLPTTTNTMGINKQYTVFVYGTLKRGHHNHKILKNALFLGKAKTVEKFRMIGEDRAFPYILGKGNDGWQIEGEAYAVNEEELRQLDLLEGVPYHYKTSYTSIQYLDDLSLDNASIYIKSTVTEALLAEKFISKWSK